MPDNGNTPDASQSRSAAAARAEAKKRHSDYAYNPYIQEFLDYIKNARGYSDNTIISYQHDLVWLFRFLVIEREGIDLDTFPKVRDKRNFTDVDISKLGLEDIRNITFPELIAFISFTADELKNSENSRKRKVTTIKSFFKYLTNTRHYLTFNPADELEAPKTGRYQPAYLTLEQAQDLLEAPRGSRHEIRDHAILVILLNTGIRVSELVNIRLEDIQSDMLHVTGKGKKDRNLFLNDACLQAISDYLPLRNRLLRDRQTKCDFLFVSQKATSFTIRGIEHLIEKYIKEIGLNPRKFTVHTLRHTAATLMHKYGAIDIRTLQHVLGHESPQTTEIYTHLDDDDVQSALTSNPLSEYETEEDKDVSSVYELSNSLGYKKD